MKSAVVTPWGNPKSNVVTRSPPSLASLALSGAITLKDGAVEQSNFHDYPVLRIDEMPKVEVHIAASSEPPGGIGEPGLPPLAPAVANAIFAATGKRLRKLPINTGELKQS